MDVPWMPAPSASTAADPAELRKPHEMIVMIPKSGRVTLTGRRLYNAMLHVAQSRLAALSQMPSADYLFEAPLNALLRTTGSSGEDRTAAKRYLSEMQRLTVDWESTAPGDGLKWHALNMLAECKIEVRAGENWAIWAFPPTILQALRDPARWARIRLDVLSRIGTYAGLALYEICSRYRDNPSGVTSRKPVAWWQDAMTAGPAGSERREWRKFKSERLKAAIEEINAETDLEVELIEHKQGRAVVEAQFAVRRKRVPVLRSETSEVVDANLVLRAESLGIRETKLEGLIKEFGEARVRSQVDVLEQRAANSQLRSVENAYSYLRSLLRNGDDEQKPAAEPAPAAAPAPAPPPSAEPTWLQRRIAQLKADLARLTPEQRKVHVDLALQELAGRRLLNAAISRRAAQGDVLHGLLGVTVVKVYATAVYGPAWDQEPAADELAADRTSA
jgi:hypothetical protein